ncbi:MAG: hypothetical protein ACR2H2_08620 [Solirubrobacteraceae bacterium]
MIELGALALLLRLMTLGYEPVIATRLVAADSETLRAFLSDPANYDGAARVLPGSSARIVAVRVRFGSRRVVRYTWILSPRRGTTEVDLAVQIESRGVVYRVALLLGGRHWLQRRLEATLATVSRVTVGAAEDIAAEPVAPVVWQDAA